MTRQKAKGRIYRAYIEQVNQAWVEVVADDLRSAVEKASRKWKREFASPSVIAVYTILPEGERSHE
jgi:hypothetical protein